MCVGKVASAKMQTPLFITKHINKKVKVNPKNRKNDYQADILAVSTYYTKIILFGWQDFTKSIQNSMCYKILFHTTQPAHLITALAILTISFILLPFKRETSLPSPIWSLVYLGAFSAHFGTQLWMTFISGLALYFNLPRHTFGKIQKVLFPKYFLLNSFLSFVTLSVFVRVQNTGFNSNEVRIQVGGMTLCFLIELLIRLYLTPPLLSLMTLKNEIEAEAGVGMEVGKLVAGDLLNCPHYMKIYKNFRRVHMMIAIGNIIAMACTVLHLYYLSQKLCSL